MAIAKTVMTVSSDSGGAASVTTTPPVSGEILEVRCPSDAFTGAGGTTNFKLTRLTDGGTIMVANGRAAPFDIRLPQGGGYDGVPCSDRVVLEVTNAQPNQEGTVYLFTRR